MAKVDNIIQQIRNAQAAAIAKNGGITANSYAKVEADTKSILQKQIAQQQSAKKETSGQAETPALPEVQDTRTTQQKHDDAKKTYDDYVSSDEYKQNQVANLKAQTDEWMNATIAGSEGYTPTPRKDQKEQQLKAEADYWKAQVEAEENQKVMDADLEELAGWSEQDRRALEQYATGQDVDFYNTLNFAQNGIQVGTAEQNAAGLFEKYGKEKVDQIAESFKRNQSQKLTQETAEAGQKHGDEHAVLSSLGSVATNTVGGVTGVLSYIRELGQRSGRYSTLDPNSIGNLGNVYSGAVRGQVAQNIAGEDGGILRQGAAYLYQGGMTMVDSFARAAAGGGPGGAAALAACNAFSQTVSDASRQGATPEQAYTLGVAVAGVEYLSEKIPMDRVFKLAKGGNTKVLAQAFTQAGIEISTEELSLLGSMAAEAAILQEKSSYKQQIGDLVAGGASYEDAKAQADKAVWEEVKQTALVSGFAGSLSGGGAAIVGNLTTNNAPEVTAEAPQEVPAEVTTAAPVVEQAEPSTALLVDGIQDMTPAPAPLTKGQRDIMAAMDGALGVQPAQQPVIEPAAPQEETEHHDEFEDWGKDPNREGVANPLTDRSYSEVGKRSVKAYMYENPAVKPFYQEQAAWLLSELADSTKGERTYNEQLHYESGGEQGWSGTKRHTSESIAELLDQDGMSYDQIERGLNAIVNDHGQENNAVSKRIEFVINDRLMNGYTDFYTGQKVPGNAEYLNLLRGQQNAPKPKKDIYFHLQSIAPEASFFDDNNNITEVTQEHFTLMDDNSVDLDLTPYSSGINRAGAIIDRFGVLYDFALDGEPIDPGDPTYRDIYVTFEDVERPIPRKIDGGSFVPDKKGVINLYSDMREIPHLKVKTQARNLETAVSQKESAPVLTEAELAQMAMEDLMGGQEQTTKAVSNPIDSYLNLLRGQQSAPDVDTSEAAQMGASNVPQQSAEGVQGIKGTGAAEGNFSGKPAYNATLSEDNSQADRRDDVRPMELPQRDINGGNISAVTGNVYGASVTPDEFASLMEEPTARGDFSYVPISNNEATQQAMENITRYGWQDAYTQWSNAVHQGRAGAEMSARGALFLNHAAQAGDRQQWLNILSDFQRLGTNTAQGLQAFRILRNLAPSDRLYMMRRSVDQMVRDMHLNVPIEIDQQLADQYQNAQTNEEADAILDEIITDVASQIPSTAADRWTALRYVNMLGNMRTQVRNISGNIGAKFTYLAKDQIGAALEKVAHAFNPDFQRTKSAWVSNDLKAMGRVDFDEVRDIVLENGRFDDARRFDSTHFAREVNERRRIFRGGFMEAYRRLTNWAMNNDYFGDAGFARSAYARAFGGYLKANGFTGNTLEGIDQNLLDDARLYAIQQAQETTFRDHNAVSDWVGRIGRRPDTPRAIRALSEGVMPFRSTPANVLVRAEEFSPLGIINTAVTAARAANPDTDITGTDVVESMAKTLTGTGLFIMGAYLGKMGLLAGGPDSDDEQAEFDQMNGYQNYALQLPDGKNITIDFLSPLAVPMFLGAEFEKIIGDGGYDLADFEKVFTSLADPLIQMSMLQGLNDTLDGIKYSENNLGQFFLNASMSYLTQGLTNTLLGQLERSSEENRMTTFVDKDSVVPQWMQRQLGKMSQKIPGWDYQQAEYLNAWGQNDKNEGGLLYNLLSPGYISTEQQTAVTRELNRLRETTGENVFPQTVERSVNFTDTDGTKHTGYNLSEKEYETMQKVQGQTSYRLMFEVISNSDYAGLTDKQKAQVIDNIYSYAQEEARKQALPKYYSEAPAWMREIGEEPAAGLIRRAALSTINTAVTNTVDNIENGWTVTPAATQDLNALYDAYESMSQEAKKQILDDAISDTAKYLEIRSRGISTDQYLDVVTDIKALKPEPNYSAIRDIQTREAIAENDSLSTREKDYVMKAYMTDYDPTAKSPQTTELKYDEIRKLGVSPEGYTAAYRDYLDASGTGKRRRTIALYMNKYGWDRSTAQKVYDLYAGYWKPWKE